MLGVAVGEIGLGVEEFYNLTFEEFAEITAAYFKKEERVYKNGWEQARFVAYYSLVPHQGKNKRLKLTDVVRFEWEKKPIVKLDRKMMDKIFPKHIKGGKANIHNDR